MNTNRTPNQTATALERTRQRLRLLEERDHPYARKVRDAGLSWRDLDSLEALSAFPFTTKQDLQEHYPLGWLGCDRADLVRFHATSGTTGNPTVVAYTASDLDAWSGYMAWCLHLAGYAGRTRCRWPTDTASSPEGWDCTGGRSAWGHRWFPPPGDSRSVRSS